MGSQRLVDYLILVGPSTTIPGSQKHDAVSEPPISPVSPSSPSEDWNHIFKPSPAILRRYPSQNRPDNPLSNDIIGFCQPEGCFYETNEASTHVFMLTHTETNVHTYGTCITFPYLVDPVARAQSPNWRYENRESVSIQEWGVLTVCLLSSHQFFGLFERCLRTLVHFIEHFGGEKLSWDLLIHAQFVNLMDGPFSNHYVLVKEVERWIERLTSLPAPEQGMEVLEIELEVDPASTIGYPPSTRLPVMDFPIHTLFMKLDVNLIIDAYRLLLTEQKVIIHSSSFSLSAQFVLMLQCLLYPLQYLFPIIPLLPSNMPKAENLLMVPTPFLVGVCSSFLRKLAEVHRSEIWLVDLDKVKIEPPTQVIDPPNFPISVLQLQADIRLALDKMESEGGARRHSKPYIAHMTPDGTSSKDEVDVLIRIAFVEFLMGPDMMGHVENHVTIYRLFPRPVVALKKDSFMSAYIDDCGDADTTFISSFIQSQSLEYFLEWILNPTNTAFEEIKRGFVDISRVGDKIHWWVQHSRPPSQQLTLYNPEEEPILYQEMLNHKASQAIFPPSDSALSDNDDSDFEIVGHEYYDGGSEMMSSDSSREGGTQVVAAEVIEIKSRRFLHGSSSLKRNHSPPLKVMVDLEMMELPGSDENDIDHDVISIDTPRPTDFQEPLPSNHNHAHRPREVASQPISVAVDSVDKPGSARNGDDNDDSARSCLPNSDLGTSPDTKEKYHTARMSSSNSMPISLSELIGRGVSSSPENGPDARQTYTPTVFLTPRSSLPADFADGLALDKGVADVCRDEASQSPQPDPQSDRDGPPSQSLPGSKPVEFSTPRDLPEDVEDGPDVLYQFPPSVVRSVPWSAVSTLHEMEQHIKELVGRIGSGQGLPWPKPQYFKKIVSEEKSRVALLRRLELRLGIREQTEMLLSVHDEIKPVVVTKAVYRGVLELLKYLLAHIEADISHSLESPIFSVFLLFRLALCLCMDVKNRSQSLRAPSSGQSRSSSSPRTPSPDPGIGQWAGGIFNLFKAEDVKEGKSAAGATRKLEEASNGKGMTSEGSKDKEMSSAQDPLNSSTEEANRSQAASSAVGTEAVSSPDKSARKNTAKPSDAAVSDDEVTTPTGSSRTTPTGRGLRRVRTLTEIEVGIPKKASLDLVYLHTELFRGLGNNVKDMMCRKAFWAALFASVVTADRRHLGWNENTVELYQRYSSLGRKHRAMFAYKEDILLSTVLHNLLVFMLMVGVSPEDTMDMCHRLSARVRLATFEERLLHQTLEELEEADNNGTGVDMRDLAMMALYSETQPVVVFIVHHGIDVTAPVYKLQITDEVCILRRFPDEKITCRFWSTLIHNITCNDQRMTVSFSYKDKAGEYFHHFHSKQYTDLFVCFLNLKLIATRNLRSIPMK